MYVIKADEQIETGECALRNLEKMVIFVVNPKRPL